MTVAQLIAAQGFVILDGGLATELERRGADLSDRLWSARQLMRGPELIRQVHEDYFAAGADVAVSASYQASIDGFKAVGVSAPDARRLIALSVELAQEARGRRPHLLVAGSVGPYGAALADGSEYRGGYKVSRQFLADFHGPRLEALIGAKPDLLAIETIPSLEEAVLLLELVREWPEMACWVSFTCRDAERVSEGQPVTEAIAEVTAHGQVMAAGFNCVPPALAEPLLQAAAGVSNKPLVIYPNSGEQWDAAGRRWIHGDGGFDFAAAAGRWHGLGARLIGGCCRTTPDTIRAIRNSLGTVTTSSR